MGLFLFKEIIIKACGMLPDGNNYVRPRGRWLDGICLGCCVALTKTLTLLETPFPDLSVRDST